MRTFATAALIFILAQCALAAIVWRYRSSVADTTYTSEQKTNRVELLWISATAAVFLGLLALGARTWAGVQFTAAPPEAENIEVLARQFAWNFRYSGPDGRFGRTDLRMIDEAAGNPFGLDETDPLGNDDIVSATLRIPAGKPVNLALRSIDVIHSFFIRELRIKQDLVPGMRIPLHFQADIPGTYEIPCAELCGLGHHQMRTVLIVMPQGEFDTWKRGQPR
ncbi:MAG: cytochrome c oxidase subunit II [Bryobacteraceae bacterium]